MLHSQFFHMWLPINEMKLMIQFGLLKLLQGDVVYIEFADFL
jgi:hypothetical protein